MSENSLTVYYDQGCMFCRSLVSLMQSRCPPSWEFVPCKENVPQNLALRVDFQGQSFLNEHAWDLILKEHPSLKAYNWMVERMGLRVAGAKLVHQTTHGLRTLCRSCSHRFARKRR
ncbi:hypothetical protein [Pseudobacteriovorax antillogorgiicola]|uniref:DUF393 domain-containing protein n=1 Tax=Pseudobacteriovorax antillogorgiicola TaxID=1513793 RepID=A0A1Y6CMF5_9BACT|nr:hypothetical protein [Pseudobacteriovorax antillogorgiicola]TCS44974.1 hypothetical protein EDD56_13011 [Pseudobacteriovorax antillogorgiicola]SMF76773.1 hypothetical protein SAMN06296036_13063 [Pseudobacteriovorax antillogorgiicola]